VCSELGSQSFLQYSRHKALINHYLLYYPGSTAIMQRDTYVLFLNMIFVFTSDCSSHDRTDKDVLHANHKFIWDSEPSDMPSAWEKRLAKKYYDKLFKEYCVADLTRYKENKV
jgi:protein FRA10AC1